MGSPKDSPQPTSAVSVIGRAVMIGSGVGVAVGGVTGTVIVPVLGTLIGTVVGAVIGAAVGLANGLVLATIGKRTPARWAAQVAGAVTCYLCAADVVWSSPLPRPGSTYGLSWLIVAVCTGLGAVLAPIASQGARPLDLGPDYGTRAPSRVAGTILVIGASSGLVVGAIAGLAVGIQNQLATSAAVMARGGLVGSLIGLAVAMLIASLFITPCLRVRR